MLKDAGLVSIIIPSFNHSRFIIQCLDSAVNDPYPFKEILILDDGSKDDSVEKIAIWLEKYKSKLNARIEFQKQENKGLCKTLNKLVEMSRGEFVTIVASDDYLLPGGIQARVNYLQRHPKKLATFADCRVVDQNDEKLYNSAIEELHSGRKKYLQHDKLRSFELVFRWCVPGPAFLARKEVYALVGKYDESIVVEDYDFYLRMMAYDVLGFTDYFVAAYRVHNHRMTTQLRSKRYGNWELASLDRNKFRFNDLRGLYLQAEWIRLVGEINRKESKFFKSWCYRLFSKILRFILQYIYEIWAKRIQWYDSSRR